MNDTAQAETLPNAAIVKGEDGRFHCFRFFDETMHHTEFSVPAGDSYEKIQPMDMVFADYDIANNSSRPRETFTLAREGVTALHELPLEELAWLVEWVFQKHYHDDDIGDFNGGKLDAVPMPVSGQGARPS